MVPDNHAVADTRTVAISTLWNLLGRAGPIVVAVLATPALVHALGDSRWGVFTIALSLIGIFGIFDFGLGRALTRTIAERLAAGETARAASTVITGAIVLTGLGVAGAAIAAGLARYWVLNVLQTEPGLQTEVLDALYILCASAPLVLLNAAMWGVIAAYQQFRVANLINIPIMIMYYVGPLGLLYVWNSLTGVMLVLLACRLAMTVGYGAVCLRQMPGLLRARPDLGDLPLLLRVGGWMTISNLAFPVLMYGDRFVIASVLSVADAGYYATSFDLVARLSIISIAVMGSAFPAFAGSFRSNPANTVAVFRRSIVAIALLLFPGCLLLSAFSAPLLGLWLGAQFAQHGAIVLVWLSFGILLTCLDGVVSGLIDGIGRPDVNAKFSMAEIVLYCPVLVFLLGRFGIEGAAIAYALRCAADLAVRLWLIGRLYPPAVRAVRTLSPVIASGCVLLGVPLLATGAKWRMALVAVAIAGFGTMIWRFAIDAAEREMIRHKAPQMFRSGSRATRSDNTPAGTQV